MVTTAYLKVTSWQSFGTTVVWGTLGALPKFDMPPKSSHIDYSWSTLLGS
jgi:hypothetical protein